MKIMVFGTFDLLHAGHENFFEQAKKLTAANGAENCVIAVIARDETVEKIKGAKPWSRENERARLLKQKGWADKIILGDLKDKYKVIKKFRPDVIALGYDQFAFTYRLEKFLIDEKMNTKIARMKPYQPEIYKSSLIRDSWISRVKERVCSQPILKNSAQRGEESGFASSKASELFKERMTVAPAPILAHNKS